MNDVALMRDDRGDDFGCCEMRIVAVGGKKMFPVIYRSEKAVTGRGAGSKCGEILNFN
jgi:hypothetical protein